MDIDTGRLLSLVSHELRNPLGVTRGYMRMLDQRDGELSEFQQRAVAASLRAMDHAAAVLNQLSTLARFHRGEVVTSRQRTEIAPLLRAAANDVVLPADPAIALDVEDAPVLQLIGDAELLRQALAGLTTAVVRAQTADHRVRVHAIRAARHGVDGILVQIIASADDAGEEHDLDVMRGGLGLDLPLAAWIVDAHRGVIRERRVGRRLTGISVWLPLERAAT